MVNTLNKRGDSMRPKKHQNINVKVIYPETEEGMKELRESQAQAMLYILEKRLGEKGLEQFIEYAREKVKNNG